MTMMIYFILFFCDFYYFLLFYFLLFFSFFYYFCLFLTAEEIIQQNVNGLERLKLKEQRRQERKQQKTPKQMDERDKERKEWREKRKRQEYDLAVKSAAEELVPTGKFSYNECKVLLAFVLLVFCLCETLFFFLFLFIS
jgi:hypothetical protein